MFRFSSPAVHHERRLGLVGRAAAKFVAVAMLVLSATYSGEAKAGLVGDFKYDNLSVSMAGGDRISTTGRGMGQSFTAGTSSNLVTAVFGLENLNNCTGDLQSALFDVTGTTSGTYAIGSQVGSTATFGIASIPNLDIYTSVDLTGLNWNLVSGQRYAVGLWSAANFVNPNGSGDGIAWRIGSGSGDNLVRFNNWDVNVAAWENWGADPATGFSLGLVSSSVSVAGVPEIDPAGFGSVLALLGGVLGLVERRRLKVTC
jgi:hypothetical protein